jgi:hypothetical protein
MPYGLAVMPTSLFPAPLAGFLSFSFAQHLPPSSDGPFIFSAVAKQNGRRVGTRRALPSAESPCLRPEAARGLTALVRPARPFGVSDPASRDGRGRNHTVDYGLVPRPAGQSHPATLNPNLLQQANILALLLSPSPRLHGRGVGVRGLRDNEAFLPSALPLRQDSLIAGDMEIRAAIAGGQASHA